MEPRRFKKKPRRFKKELRIIVNKYPLVIPILWFLMMFIIPVLMLGIVLNQNEVFFYGDFFQYHEILFFTIPLVPGVFCFVMGIKKLRISTRVARELEMWGYALLFFALIWQFVVMDSQKSMDEEYNEEELNYKLDHIWSYMNEMDIDSEDRKANSNEYFEYADHEWPTHLDNDDGMDTKLKILYGFVYFFSTVFIAIGRFHEIKGINN
ncbi:hypothetical protein CQ056_25000 [Peribacillus simplex]|uniref:hypothetical protein n=1 Tax=Peribacillus TaxID=2675229 RepID=UPI000CFF2582|nr:MULTISPECIES: hypothetical protein [Peribacillus]MCF7624507.1 hypothetical protein [Peribacillus frigoritolerans]PRA78215.1 hypothetical protein CQ056_25000 [Peribacillus simplex]